MLLHIDVILVLLLVTATFFSFSKSVIFFVCSLKGSQSFLIQSLLWHNKYFCFLCDQIVNTEYPQGMCSPIFLHLLFSHLSIFLVKDPMSAKLMYEILSNFIY